MITYVDTNGEGYTDDSLHVTEGIAMIPLQEAITNGQRVTLWRHIDELIDPDGKESRDKEELVVSVSSEGFVIEWVSMDGTPTYRTIQLTMHHNGWLMLVSDEDTKALGIAMTWFSVTQWQHVLVLIETYDYLVTKKTNE